MKSAEAAKEASRLLGSQAEMARRLRVKAPTVNQWCSGKRAVPARLAIEIEVLTGGAVDRASLCPAFPWSQIQSSANKELSVA